MVDNNHYTTVTLEIDTDVLTWYQSQRENYKSLMLEVLKAYIEEYRNSLPKG